MLSGTQVWRWWTANSTCVLIVLFSTVVALYLVSRYLPRTNAGRAVIRKILLRLLNSLPAPFTADLPFAKRVQPHGDIQPLAENLWFIDGRLPNYGNLQRIMIVFRSPSTNDLMVYSPMALREDTMRKLNALGEVKFIFIPCTWHTLDVAVWSSRYPNAKVVAPRAAVEGVKRKTGLQDIIPAEDVFSAWDHTNRDIDRESFQTKLITPVGVSREFDELALLVPIHLASDSASNPKHQSYALIFNDMLHNPPCKDPKKLAAAKKKSSTPTLAPPNFGMYGMSRLLAIQDSRVMRGWLRDNVINEILEELDVEILTVSHGDPVSGRDVIHDALLAAVESIY